MPESYSRVEMVSHPQGQDACISKSRIVVKELAVAARREIKTVEKRGPVLVVWRSGFLRIQALQ